MILSLHNIAFYKRMMCDIRESILTNTFEETKKLYLYKNEKFKKTRYLGKNTKLNQDNPDKFILDPIDNLILIKIILLDFLHQSLLVYARLLHNLTLEISSLITY